MHIAAGIEISLQLQPGRRASGHPVIHDAISDLLVGDAAIAPAIHIELERLELHHPGARLINQAQGGKIRIARKRAEAGELREGNCNLIGPRRPGIVKADQLGLGDGPLAVGGRLGEGLAQGLGRVQGSRGREARGQKQAATAVAPTPTIGTGPAPPAFPGQAPQPGSANRRAAPAKGDRSHPAPALA